MISIEGVVEEIIFTNESNGFTVCDIASIEEELITVVGYMPYLSRGETVKVSGRWMEHPAYGKQIKVDYYEKILPATETAIFDYLASGTIKGIREATARKILDKFGEKSLEIIQYDPLRLAEIKGISKNKAEAIGIVFEEQREVRNIVMFLQPYGISPNNAVKIYKRHGNGAVNKIKENPYILCDEVYSVGFKAADKIALGMGVSLNSIQRIKAGIKHILAEAAFKGHTYLPSDVLMDKVLKLLQVYEEEIENAIVSLMIEKSIYLEKTREAKSIYLESFHRAEIEVASLLIQLSFNKEERILSSLDDEINSIESETGIILAKQQRQAVKEAMGSGVIVITGGPGTGKTTIINTIIQILDKNNYSIALAAPTGRASKRLAEMTGKEAQTIHRLLGIGYSDESDSLQITRDETDPLKEDVIIIDETSMVDIVLMNHLLKALKKDARLILVGDVDQLPSVGPGNVLKDIIQSNIIKVVRLNEIFRQARQSMIIVNAHKINRGVYPELNVKGKDFYFVSRSKGEDIAAAVVGLCKERLPSFYGSESNEIQVITPMRKSPAGVFNLNIELQKQLNPHSKDKVQKIVGKNIFREGDKIMQIKNNYNIKWKHISKDEEGEGVFNGDIGYINKIYESESTLEVLFDEEKIVQYEFSRLDELELAYAMTVHKSQGNEFPVVVMPVFYSGPLLMSRNLLYTAITRARKLVVLVGKEDIIKYMVDNNREMERYSGLKYKLEEKEMTIDERLKEEV